MSGNNYLKFITEEFVKYFNSPRESRRINRLQGKTEQQFYANRWFGIFPFSVKLFIKNKS